MPLSQQDADKVQRWFTQKICGYPRCPICGSSRWTLHDEMAGFSTVDKQGNVELAARAPMVVFVCDQCAHTVTFSAMHIGLTS